VKQHVYEESSEPVEIRVYPGSDTSFLLYEDDGKSFNHRKGEWMGLQFDWSESRQVLHLRLAEGSKMLPPLRRSFDCKIGATIRRVEFEGQPLQIQF
jgi:hypothetical protein